METSRKIKPINLKQLFANYLYHWPLFIFFLSMFLGAAYLYSQFVKPTYELRATLIVKDEKKTSDEKSALQEIDQLDEPKIAENEVEILSSRKLINDVVNKLGLWVNYSTKSDYWYTNLYGKSPVKFKFIFNTPDFKPFHLDIIVKSSKNFSLINDNNSTTGYLFNQSINSEFGTWTLLASHDVIKFLGKKISIDVSDPNSISEKYQQTLQVSLANKLAPTISLSLTDKQKSRGLDFLDTLIGAYNQSAAEEENKLTKTTLDFINRRLDSLVIELNNAERAVTDFRSKKGLTDVTSESKVYLENVQNNDAKLNDVNVQLNVLDGIEKYVNSPLNSNNVPATLGISDPTLTNAIDKLIQLQLQRERLLSSVPESNPIYDPINRQIKVTKNTISNSIKTIRTSLLSQKKELESFNLKFESSIKNIPGQERDLLNVKRQQDIKGDLYVYLLQKKEELSLKYASIVAGARVVDNAYVGSIVWPQMSLLFTIAFLAGLIVPIVMVYLRDNVKDKIQTKSDIEEELGIQISGELPIENLGKAKLTDHCMNTPLSEQIRAIRTKLINSYDLNNSKSSVMMVTSSLDNEGKSFVSANLSSSFAFYGKATILIELDLRRPKLAGIFNLASSNEGLSDYLNSSEQSIDLIIRKSEYNQNLDIITAGSQTKNPAELLGNGRFNILLGYLKEKYDIIILDTPPLHLVTDALVIASLADITLFIVRQNVTAKPELNFIKGLIDQNQLKNLNILFNGVERNRFGYGSHYSNKYYNQPVKFSFNQVMKKFATRF